MKPNSEMALIDKPRALVRKMAPRNATGTPALTQKASRGRKNNASNTSTITNPWRALFNSVSSRSLRADRLVIPDSERNSRWQSRSLIANIFLHRIRDFLDVLLAQPRYFYQCTGPAVEAQELIGVGEAIIYRGDIPQVEAGAVCAGCDHEVLKIPAGICLALGA